MTFYDIHITSCDAPHYVQDIHDVHLVTSRYISLHYLTARAPCAPLRSPCCPLQSLGSERWEALPSQHGNGNGRFTRHDNSDNSDNLTNTSHIFHT